MKKKIIKKFFVCCVIFFILYLTRYVWLPAIGNFLVVKSVLNPADLIYVFGGNTYEKANYGAELFKLGYGKKIMAGGEKVPDILKIVNLPLKEFQLAEKVFKESGIEKKDTILIHKGTSTIEELNNIKEYMIRKKMKSIIFVSAPIHMRRIWLSSKILFFNSGIQIYYAATKKTEFSPKNWWQSEKMAIEINNEYMKMMYYILTWFKSPKEIEKAG